MTTLNLTIGDGDDDASERDDSTNFTSTLTTLIHRGDTNSTNRRNIGHRFPGASIPAGATIDSADLGLKATSTKQDDMNADIFLEDVDTPDDYVATADVTSRTRTTASVLWSADALGTGRVHSPALATVVQEWADRAGHGSAINALVDCVNAATKEFVANSYDGNPSNSATFDIDFTAAARVAAHSGALGSANMGIY